MVKKYSPIADEHHVVRRCGHQVIEWEGDTPVGLYPWSMMLRKTDEGYLSANWLEHCPGTKIERLRVIVDIHRRKSRSKKLSPKSGVAVLNSGRISAIARECGHQTSIRYTPSKEDPSYSRISGLPLDNSDMILIGMLADEGYLDFHLLRDLDVA
jgi:hypothetical protein